MQVCATQHVGMKDRTLIAYHPNPASAIDGKSIRARDRSPEALSIYFDINLSPEILVPTPSLSEKGREQRRDARDGEGTIFTSELRMLLL